MTHLFPIIKEALYSEKEIFLREIVSNACDAATKLKRLISLGEAKDVNADDFKIKVILDADAKTITVVDNGIGMDGEEVRRYLCQVALSGALEFIEKYEGKDSDSAGDGIIGHFGLGFYSAFMVSETVDVYTRSWTKAAPVKWTCSSDGDWEIGDSDEVEDEFFDERGTAVVMHIAEESSEYLSEFKLRDVLDKYCAFMPVPIYLEIVGKEAEKDADGNEKPVEPINDTNPLWLRTPSDCTEEEYTQFYRKVFADYREPLFHVHLRADFPVKYNGILFFPRISTEFENLEGQIKLYYNQVFVADNIKEILPEYLLMVRGVIECPDLPLNVSRSYLQNSTYVTKIASHITKKVADKIGSMFNEDRSAYEKLWRDLKVFVRYASIRDAKFAERVRDYALLEKTDGTFVTVGEYLDAAKETNENKIYYTTDAAAQSAYIKMLTDQNIAVVELSGMLDTQYMQSIETEREGVKFLRVDAEVADAISGGEADADESLTELFKKVCGEDTAIEFKAFKDAETPAILTVSEDERRFGDMMRMYSVGKGADMPEMPQKATLVLNTACPIIERLKEGGEKSEMIAKYVYSLARLSSRKLSGTELGEFLTDSYRIISEIQ
ncbi:MAG: molecular chaperone HtpG, partial [Clostridia bacterium]|nr:molecular chaperone HtpG [Clostridia bacterium]